MGNSKNANKGRKKALGGHMTKKSLGKWLVRLKNFSPKISILRFALIIDLKSITDHSVSFFLVLHGRQAVNEGWLVSNFFPKMHFLYKNDIFMVFEGVKCDFLCKIFVKTTEKLLKNAKWTKNWPNLNERVNKYVKPIQIHLTRIIPGISIGSGFEIIQKFCTKYRARSHDKIFFVISNP